MAGDACMEVTPGLRWYCLLHWVATLSPVKGFMWFIRNLLFKLTSWMSSKIHIKIEGKAAQGRGGGGFEP